MIFKKEEFLSSVYRMDPVATAPENHHIDETVWEWTEGPSADGGDDDGEGASGFGSVQGEV